MDEVAERRARKQSACANSPEGHKFDEWPGTWGTCERCGLTVNRPELEQGTQENLK